MLVQSSDEDPSTAILNQVNKESAEIARRTEPSVLSKISYAGMTADGWMSDMLKELSSRCPKVHNILCSLLEISHHPEKKHPVLCLIYGVIAFLQCHELSWIQRINSVLLIQGQASVNVSVSNT